MSRQKIGLSSRSAWFAVLVLILGCAPGRYGRRSHESPVKMEKASFAVPLGERMKFSIRWLGLEVGTADVWVKEISKVRGRDAYHIEVKVRSNRLIDLVYPVRDEHHSYVDVERLHSLRYERIIQEGRYRADEMIDYDQEAHKARYESRRSGTVKEMLVPKDVQDQLSCTFWFRIQEMEPGDKISMPVNIDEKNWQLGVDVIAWDKIDVKGFGPTMAIKVEPLARFHGLFVRRGRAWGWMSADDRRIPLLMETQIPVLGTIYMVITEYELGNYHVKA